MATGHVDGAMRRKLTETKQAVKTTEFFAYLLVLLGLFIAGAVTQADAVDGTVDALPASRVWLYAIILTVGYLISRGLAKSGSHDPYSDQPATGGNRAPIGDRVKAAATALREGDGAGSTYSDTEPAETRYSR
jgi:hypothetical protein